MTKTEKKKQVCVEDRVVVTVDDNNNNHNNNNRYSSGSNNNNNTGRYSSGSNNNNNHNSSNNSTSRYSSVSDSNSNNNNSTSRYSSGSDSNSNNNSTSRYSSGSDSNSNNNSTSRYSSGSDSNNNSSRYSSGSGASSYGKYQLRPRSMRSRRHYDPDWSLPDALEHKPRPPPLSRYRRKTANARERCRMRQINSAFESLRGVLPSWVCRRQAAADMTKISTLKLASAYIRSLQDMLDGNAPQDTCAWVLSGVFDEKQQQQQQPTHTISGDDTNNRPQPQPQTHTTHDTTDLLTLLCGASDAILTDTFESSSYLSTTDADQDTVTLLLLGADPPRCWT
ncbi:hypothetical protein Pmani_030509 [Petrolisthes manimaculis]|uniref:BHLH domain-containing protein n=1 Tax=Petrolisthes manimaculis TaxID=1843537 RepID=A0AAE1NVF9_9EUCA|nr:hypothetical protein Pmani_030509 [Petrolisthes manimaculis]